MADPIKRTETTHIDEVKRTSTSTPQWLLEKANMAGTHPISHNNKLTFFIGGQDAFADIAKSIETAKASIDLCCWGFDPGMELIRNGGDHWPRGETYGDLLIAAGRRGVKVRLLVWYDAYAVRLANPRNMPGYTHAVDSRRRSLHTTRRPTNALHSLALARVDLMGRPRTDLNSLELSTLARRNYCMDWYDAAFGKHLEKLENIEVRMHSGDADAIAKSLLSEPNQPSNGARFGLERQGLVRFGTHHQKPILIDLFHDEGRGAVGYVMGLNSLTDYWDSSQHRLDDPRREFEVTVGGVATPGCKYVRPMRDYACRIDGGRALLSVHQNFIKAWERLGASKPTDRASGKVKPASMPETCLRKARTGDSTVQIVRTQPAEKDKTIRDAYFQATDQAALGTGYIYLENQYFQYTEWAQRLMKTRKTVMDKWNSVSGASGKSERDMPLLHVFIVIPRPERGSMIPRTYDTLATLGQQEGMTGQCGMIKASNEQKPTFMGGIGQPFSFAPALPEVVVDANRIEKPSLKMLQDSYGLKICTAMLYACDSKNGTWRYREIYIHSKLLLIDDTYVTLGSANLNQRSMAVDSEINLAAVAPDKVRELRRRIWAQFGGQDLSGGHGSAAEIFFTFIRWTQRMRDNKNRKGMGLDMSGLLLPFEDDRKSLVRLG